MSKAFDEYQYRLAQTFGSIQARDIVNDWAALLPGLAAGKYTLCCRTIDEKGIAQPMPRPFQKSGHAAIESVDIIVKS